MTDFSKRSALKMVALTAVAAAALVAGGARWLSQRQPASNAAKTSAPAAPVIELSVSDVVQVQNMDMVLGLIELRDLLLPLGDVQELAGGRELVEKAMVPPGR